MKATSTSSSPKNKAALDSFNPSGLRALVVDHDPSSLCILANMLRTCHYKVTPCSHPKEALSLIRRKGKFDIAISDVHFLTDMDGIQFLEILDHETDLPVVVISADDRNDVIMKCVIKGACTYLQKPVRMEAIQLLWQHVVRKKILCVKQHGNVENGELNSVGHGEDQSSSGEKENCGSSDGGQLEHERNNNNGEDDKVNGKKRRLVWTDELHQQFVDIVQQIGLQNAVPKKVLELMNVPGLTRENVASHLQKYRLNLRKQIGISHEGPTIMQVAHPVSNSVLDNGTSIPLGSQMFNHGLYNKDINLAGDHYIGHDSLSLKIPTTTQIDPPFPFNKDVVGVGTDYFTAYSNFYENNHSSCIMQSRNGHGQKMPRLHETGRSAPCISLYPEAQGNKLYEHDFSDENISTATGSLESNVFQDHYYPGLHSQLMHHIQPSK